MSPTRGLVAFLALLLLPAEAHALYLDPGTGSLVLQVVAAAALTVALTFKNLSQWLKHTLSRLFRAKRTGGTPNDRTPR